MTQTTEMMKSMSMPAGVDMTAMQECIDQCSVCMQACSMCADEMAGMPEMGRCAVLCMNCADVCDATMRMMLRPSGMDMTAMRAMLQACMAMCEASMTECRSHGDMSPACAMCAQACEACMKACQAMMDSMAAA
jgi:hypothetical protein